MKNKKTAITIIVAIAIAGIAAFIIFSEKNNDKPEQTTPAKTAEELYKGPNVIKQTVKLKNIPRFRKIIKQQEKE